MSDFLSGRTGTVTIDASIRCDVSQFSANYQDAINTTVTACSDGWQITGRGNRKVSGTITFKIESSDPITNSYLDAQLDDGLVALILTGDTGVTWSGNARLGGRNWTNNTESGGWQECTVPFESDGAWTFAG